MMMNLFSMFDPSTSILNFSFNWFSILLGLFLIPYFFWLIPNNYNLFYFKILNFLFNEFKVINNNKMNSVNLIFISIFIFILMSNFISLFPYIFTSTSHLVLNLTLALPLWFSFLIYGWLNKTHHMFSHLVPQGTPLILIPFMICIETVSNVIRPLTLMIRLTANLIAGHLLLTLLGNLGPSLFLIFIPFLLFIQILLLTLESAVAIIQSYVFSILMTLYYNEIYIFF